jgi:dCMP deaminase
MDAVKKNKDVDNATEVKNLREEEEKARQKKWDDRYLALADHIRQWSKDPKGKVGAVITSPSLGRVISIGFNGFPINVSDSAERLANKTEKLGMIIHA